MSIWGSLSDRSGVDLESICGSFWGRCWVDLGSRLAPGLIFAPTQTCATLEDYFSKADFANRLDAALGSKSLGRLNALLADFCPDADVGEAAAAAELVGAARGCREAGAGAACAALLGSAGTRLRDLACGGLEAFYAELARLNEDQLLVLEERRWHRRRPSIDPMPASPIGPTSTPDHSKPGAKSTPVAPGLGPTLTPDRSQSAPPEGTMASAPHGPAPSQDRPQIAPGCPRSTPDRAHGPQIDSVRTTEACPQIGPRLTPLRPQIGDHINLRPTRSGLRAISERPLCRPRCAPRPSVDPNSPLADPGPRCRPGIDPMRGLAAGGVQGRREVSSNLGGTSCRSSVRCLSRPQQQVSSCWGRPHPLR